MSQKRPSQPWLQSQRKSPMPSMHVPWPQHGLSHGCSSGDHTVHWSPSATWGSGAVTGATNPIPVPIAPRREWESGALTEVLGPEGQLWREGSIRGRQPSWHAEPTGASRSGPGGPGSLECRERRPSRQRGSALLVTSRGTHRTASSSRPLLAPHPAACSLGHALTQRPLQRKGRMLCLLPACHAPWLFRSPPAPAPPLPARVRTERPGLEVDRLLLRVWQSLLF